MRETSEITLDEFGRVCGEIVAAASGLPAKTLAYRPGPNANSIGWLIWHMTRVQDDHVSALSNRPQAYVEDSRADRLVIRAENSDLDYGHTSAQMAAARSDSPDDLPTYTDAVTAPTEQYLATVDAKELDRTVGKCWDPPVSTGVRLVSVISGCLRHAGQANHLRGLQQRRTTSSSPELTS